MRAEVRLRVPNMKVPALDANGYPINHTDMRFRKVIEIPRIPQVGDSLELATASGLSIPATIGRVELDEERQLFVLSCVYANRSISAGEYAALSSDSEYSLKHLLE